MPQRKLEIRCAAGARDVAAWDNYGGISLQLRVRPGEEGNYVGHVTTTTWLNYDEARQLARYLLRAKDTIAGGG